MLTDLDQEFFKEVAVMVAESRHPKTGMVFANDYMISGILLGRLLQLNGVQSINEIVKAAAEAERSRTGECASLCGCGPSTRYHEGACVPQPPLDHSAFFRAIATEALGGEKVFRMFGRLKLPSEICRRCTHPHEHDRSERRNECPCGCVNAEFFRPFTVVPTIKREGSPV